MLIPKNDGGPATILARGADGATRLRLLEAGLCWSRRAPVAHVDVKLVVRRGAASLEWRGATIGFTHQQFPVLMGLLEGARSQSRVASGPIVEDATGPEAKDLIRELRQRVEAVGFSGAEAKSLIRALHGRGYTVGVAPAKIPIEA